MASNPKVNISSSAYEAIKKLPESARKAALIKEVTKAAKEAGYSQADLLKETTNISFKINARFKTVEKSSAKSKVIKDMANDVEAEKENELQEEEKKKEQEEAKKEEQEEKEKEKDENEQEKDKDKDKDKDEKDKDKDKNKEKEKEKEKQQEQEQEDQSKEKNPNTLKISITDRLLEEISGLAAEDAKNVIRLNIEGQAYAQGFDMEKLHRPCGGLSINDAEKNQTASASTPNGSTLLDNLVEIVYASCMGKNVEEQAQACEEGDSRHMSDAEHAIGRMVGPTAEQEVELERGGLEPGAFAPSGMTPHRPY